MTIDWLAGDRPRVADGGQPQVDADTARENPAFFKAAMQVQVRAGARVLRVASPQAARLCRELEVEGLRLWATLGPSGRLLALKEVDADELAGHFEQRVAAFRDVAPDLLWLHSFADIDEALIALRVAQGGAAGCPVGVSMELGSGPEGLDTLLGCSCEDAAARLDEAGAEVVGANCRLPIDEMVLAVRLMRTRTDRPIAVFPDAGQRELDGDAIVHRETPEEFAAKAGSLAAAGAAVIGGCCGVTPEHIAALAAAMS